MGAKVRTVAFHEIEVIKVETQVTLDSGGSVARRAK